MSAITVTAFIHLDGMTDTPTIGWSTLPDGRPNPVIKLGPHADIYVGRHDRPAAWMRQFASDLFLAAAEWERLTEVRS